MGTPNHVLKPRAAAGIFSIFISSAKTVLRVASTLNLFFFVTNNLHNLSTFLLKVGRLGGVYGVVGVVFSSVTGGWYICC